MYNLLINNSVYISATAAILMGVFKAKDLESRIMFFWFAFIFIIRSLPNDLIDFNMCVYLTILTSMGISVFQGIRKRDKIYLITLTASVFALIQIFFLLRAKS